MSSEQNLNRCSWCESSELYQDYHDTEWGVPLMDSNALFRLLMLEGQQAGLSWITVLNKRAYMDEVFAGFDPRILAQTKPAAIERWVLDAGLIRHRGKLEALIGNARSMLGIADFAAWLWSFAAAADEKKPCSIPSQTAQSVLMSKALKKAGFRFVGPTICYAFMQSAGMVNDHHPDCWRYEVCEPLVQQALKAR